MFFSFFTRSLTHIAAYLYPSFSTYKALSPPSSSRELERWLEYWAVLGSFLAIESLVGWWVIGWWMPFYDEIKLLAVLWMVAPQVEGSTAIYNYYLAPFFTSHENDIDAVLGDLRSLAGGWIQRGIAYAWALAREKLNLAAFLPSSPPSINQNQHQQASLGDQQPHTRLPTYSSSNSDSLLPPSLRANQPQGYAVPPSLHNQPPAPASAHTQAFQYASSLLATYGPSVISQAQAHFVPTSSHHIDSSNPTSSRQPQSQPRPQPQPHTSSSSSSSSVTGSGPDPRLRRRAQLEAELAALASPPAAGPSKAVPRSRHNSNSPPSSDESLLGKSAWGEIDSDEGLEAPSSGGGMAGVGAGGAGGRGGWMKGWGGSP